MQTETLQSYLKQDPNNPALLADVARAAFSERKLEVSEEHLRRREKLAPLPADLLHLKALIAMESNRHAEAVPLLEQALSQQNDPAGRFALAWANAVLGDFEAANAALDDEAIASSPKGPALKIKALHHLDRLDEALDIGAHWAVQAPSEELFGALSVAALDAERPDLARTYAQRAGAHPDALSTLASLELDAGNPGAAAPLWAHALEKRPDDARALIGTGLSQLLNDAPQEGARYLDRGAERFGTHLGSWIAAGWAHFAAGDWAAARARFEHALALDDTFAETHGSLAALDALEGNAASALKRAQVARKLDANSGTAALASSLLAAQRGDETLAARIREQALNAPIDESGRTLGQAVAKLNLALAGRRR